MSYVVKKVEIKEDSSLELKFDNWSSFEFIFIYSCRPFYWVLFKEANLFYTYQKLAIMHPFSEIHYFCNTIMRLIPYLF